MQLAAQLAPLFTSLIILYGITREVLSPLAMVTKSIAGGGRDTIEAWRVFWSVVLCRFDVHGGAPK
jgi:hypothetical protein